MIGPPAGGEDRRRRAQVAVSASVFVLLFTALLIIMLPNAWAVLAGVVFGGAGAAATYGTMSGMAQSSQRRTRLLSDDQSSLRESLAELESTIRSRAEKLPPSTQGQLRMMVVGLEEIVDRWSTLERLPEQQDAVRRTITRHLPRTLELFLELPDSAKPTHAGEFKEQIGLLAEAVAKTRDTVVAKNLQALRTNRWLLEESLTDPDEKLFRDHGL
ncbi:hypothetical protein [Nesterenkonia sp. HG001]|uniref:hypothetical protein n=1 Tax=Nesterenkonia sp. HG001 TaxID=2983207 RepID=UPI002AC5A5CC|nr:hypothetical protein [Nesterenkonia sp. HG001]MDZ5079218.1 hypothetical protein [Nesterenkonia sp. HG001]